MRVAAGNAIGHRHALFLTLVRKHESAHAIADGPDAVDAGATLLVHPDEAALIERHATIRREQILRVGTASDRNDDLVGTDAIVAALRRSCT